MATAVPLARITHLPKRGGYSDSLLTSLGLLAAEGVIRLEMPLSSAIAESRVYRRLKRRITTLPRIGPLESVVLEPNQWSPFNSQTTWWWPDAYPLVYLPSFCSFRMTDIRRSFVAQRCMWELDLGVAYHAPEVYQDRNEHDLMWDFEDEVHGYVGNERLCALLSSLDLEPGVDAVSHNLLACYARLVECGFFPNEELALVKDWVADWAETGDHAACSWQRQLPSG
ncbi:MAG: DUF288 domain-containing protein [Armatimonadetes bacterium]|nr:DUF288 domain-containing protein [Armatimonadota bacterium]